MVEQSERVRQIQEELAQRVELPEEEERETLTVLTFVLAGERYALPLGEVREVSRIVAITSIPGLPPTVAGAMGLRGEILPVLDLHGLLSLETQEQTAESRLVIVQHEGTSAALQVDQIEDIAVVPVETLRTPPSDTGEENAALLQGISGEGQGTIRLLDLARLLKVVRDGA
jgi:purine-binding chemotaxis protein CheW